MSPPQDRRNAIMSRTLIAATVLVAVALLAAALLIDRDLPDHLVNSLRLLGLLGALVVALASARLLSAQQAQRHRQEAAARRTRLLTESAAQLANATTLEAALHSLPPMIMRILEIDHASVLLPQPNGSLRVAEVIPGISGREVPARSVSARALRSGLMEIVPDSRNDPDYYSFESEGLQVDRRHRPARSNIALPLRSDGVTFAVLNVEREIERPFDDEDRDTLSALGRIVEANAGRLEARRLQLKRGRTARLLADLTVELSAINEAAEAMKRVVDTLITEFELTGGCGLEFEGGRFRSIVGSEVLPGPLLQLLRDGLPWNTGDLPRIWSGGDPYLQPNLIGTTNELIRELGIESLAILAVPDEYGETVALLGLGRLEGHYDWSEDELALIRGAFSTLGLVLGRLSTRARERRLLEVVRQLASSDDIAELYDQVVRAATEIIPGAEAASLLIRDPQGGYTFEAAVGYDLAELRSVGPLSEANQLSWHGGGVEAWRAGQPRLLSGPNVAALSAVLSSDETRSALRRIGRIQRVISNLCTPVAIGGEVIAMLNLDAFSHSGAFGRRSLQLAQLLGQHAAVIVRRAQDRMALAHMARTDPLTQLGNRSAFNEALERAIERAPASGASVGLALLDLDRFKWVNDRFGHPIGDQILVRAADAMSTLLSPGDRLYRWGGDEFALLLEGCDHAGGEQRVAAVLAALQGLEPDQLRLHASVGFACYPEEAASAQALTRLADERMYLMKRRLPDTPDG